ncbi:hypothetical protein NW752_002307 [Fusarium irregulare]|uniref:Uncharacterized protein n=1 Tax=Fusarium irregulare TaxID=2494466 RepID=A0A9W8PFT4_9HYPO|nr:hypothetical protein NW766_011024 [Fusarium irregulare]KAJ4024854.1 hypothetical protein NW752_002307 [Fusarium irregulare]
MLAFKQIFLSAIFLFSLLTSGLSQEEKEEEGKKEYDPSENRRPENVTGLGDFYGWVGSYYNATVEAEFVVDFTPWVDLDPSEQCEEVKNFSTTVKYDAILSLLEHRKENPGNNSLEFWLTLMPQASGPTNVSDFGAWWMRDRENRSYVFSAQPLDDPPYRIHYGPDYFNFTTTQVSGGAYNITETLAGRRAATWQNMKVPVCNSTEYKDEWRVVILDRGYYFTEDEGLWTGSVEYDYPKTSLQFDDKTANMTFAAFWVAYAIQQPDYDEVVDNPSLPTWRHSTVIGRVSFNFSGVLDEYHSDVLSLENSSPVWQRTVGFGNNSANIGYGDTPDSRGERTVGRAGLALMAVIVSIGIVL